MRSTIAFLMLSSASMPQLSAQSIDPNGTFLSNFNNSTYQIQMATSNGSSGTAGDVFALYSQVAYKTTYGYSLIVLGTFPESSTISLTCYDSHEGNAWDYFNSRPCKLTDYQILPLTSGMVNPFVAGQYLPNQQFGITVGFGSRPPVSPQAGCSAAGTTIDQNFIDASEIHAGLSWNGYVGLPAGFPAHQTGYNPSGILIYRNYNSYSTTQPPIIIVRNNVTGCAITAADAISKGIVSTTSGTGPGMNNKQIAAHAQFVTSIEPQECYPADPSSDLPFRSSPEYMTLANYDANPYLGVNTSTSTLNKLAATKSYLVFKFKVPSVRPIGTPYTGAEQLAYWSVSFESGSTPLYGYRPEDLYIDGDGNTTIIVNTVPGQQPPPVAYTSLQSYVDLTLYGTLTSVALRNVLPAAGFACSTANVPFRSSVGPFMGLYTPSVKLMTAAQIPSIPVYPYRTDSCLNPPPPPTTCKGN